MKIKLRREDLLPEKFSDLSCSCFLVLDGEANSVIYVTWSTRTQIWCYFLQKNVRLTPLLNYLLGLVHD